MATLVLTAAGSLLGPIGGAVGALIGQSIDGRLLKPKGREGPRLADLRVQTSSYGTPIPKLFGRMRVAGTVIWSTDLVERRSRQGGGKGRPSTTTYSYSASFAVALSARPIRSVGRIWADGNLLRGAAGDWKQETGFRLHLGDEDQARDPFIAAAEGSAGAPAYRGCAYAVFENMALEPYGNRIPSLTFEVKADPTSVPVGGILSALSGGAVDGAEIGEVAGFAASGDSLAGLISGLGDLFPLTLRDDGERLRVAGAGDAVAVLGPEEIQEGRQLRRADVAATPAVLTLSHYDPLRDYQLGVQSAAQPGARGVARAELPAALAAGDARALAEAALERRRRERTRQTVTCGWQRLALGTGSTVRFAGDASLWRVERRSVEREGVTLDLKALRLAPMTARPADPGRDLPARDEVHGPTRLHLLDLPPLEDAVTDAPRLHIAACGELRGWRRASLLASLDDGASWLPISGTALPAVIGVADEALRPASAEIVDRVSDMVVALAHDAMLLEDATDERLLAGANLALVGEELIQFGSAIPLGGNRWRLSRLLRGRRGTEFAISGHAAGERFVLIEADTLQIYDPPLASVGGRVRVLASGIGDGVPAEAQIDAVGESLRPPHPVHLTARPRADGGFDIAWIRRSRLGWNWGEVETPLAEPFERYRVVVRRSDGAERAVETIQPSFDYDPVAVASDRAVGSHVDIDVFQLGGRASRPASIRIAL